MSAPLRSTAERPKSKLMTKGSEGRYHLLMEGANDAIFVADAATGVILDVNTRAAELLGMPAERIIGMHQTQLHPKEDAERYRKMFLEHVRSGKAVAGDMLVRHRSGRPVPVEISASVIESGGKKVIQGIFRDISERKKAKQALKQRVRELSREPAAPAGMLHERDLLRHLSEQQSALIGGTMRRVSLSAAARRLSGGRAGEDLLRAVCREACRILGAKRAAIVLRGSSDPLAAWPQAGDRFKPTARVRLPGGTLLIEGDGRDKGMLRCFAAVASLALHRSLAERHMAELAVMESHHHLANTLQGVGMLLRMRCGEKCRRPALRTALASLSAAAASHRLAASGKPMNLEELVQGLGSEAWEPMLSETGIALHLRTVSVSLAGRQATCLAMVLNELVMNAAEHAFPEGRAGSVRVSASKRDGRLALVVADDGVGLPDGRLPAGKFGLGLQIMQRIVEEELGGRLTITGKRGVRSRVEIPV